MKVPGAVNSMILFFLLGNQTVKEGPNLDSSLFAGIINRRAGWGGAFGHKAHITSAVSVIQRVGTVVIGEPENGPKKDRKTIWNLF